jgi:RNA polymerase sigma factor (sigma-70 family)
MTADPATPLARCLRRVTTAPEPDGRLLDRFRTGRDEAAFAELVARHARMVFGVCRRVLGNAHDAEDAFQAAFIVLVRRSGELTGRDTLGDWLYGVAYRTALKVRANAVKRRSKEAAAGRPIAVEPHSPDGASEALDAELAALPAKYREPLVLCELEGRPRREVAATLGVPEGTVASRLATGKRMLADRLRRRGFAAGAGVLGLAGVAGAVPPGLIESAVRSAVGAVPVAVAKLAAEVTRAMFLTKLRVGVVVLAAALLGGAAGLSALSHVAAAPEAMPARLAARDGVTAKDLTDKSIAAQKDLEGTWELQRMVIDDKEQEFQFDYYRHVFAGRTVKVELKRKGDRKGFESEESFTVNPTATPAEITFYRDFLVMGIYELNGDTLRLAFHGVSELERPRGFAVADKRIADLPLSVWEFKRKAPEKPRPANPPAAKAPEPAWKAEFNKVYGLKDGEVLRRVVAPYPESREAFYKSTHGEQREGRFTYDRYFSVFHWKGGRIHFGSATVPVNQDDGLPLLGLLGHVGFPRQEIEGDDALLDTKITGDFVLRTGTDPAKVAARLEEILRKDCNLAVALAIREVEREVVVARGKYRSKPLPGKDENHIELYAIEHQSPEDGGSQGGATFPDFLRHLGGFINRRLVNEVEGAPKTVTFHDTIRSPSFKDPTTGVDTYAEDTDPEKVLKNVAAQTGLTFTTEKRKVRVLFVEKAGK